MRHRQRSCFTLQVGYKLGATLAFPPRFRAPYRCRGSIQRLLQSRTHISGRATNPPSKRAAVITSYRL
ncbi:hypothetical protein M3J09_000097 [Ascochyta lentis]